MERHYMDDITLICRVLGITPFELTNLAIAIHRKHFQLSKFHPLFTQALAEYIKRHIQGFTKFNKVNLDYLDASTYGGYRVAIIYNSYLKLAKG